MVAINSHLQIPGKKITFFGNIYSVVLSRYGWEVVQNDPNANPFDVNTRSESQRVLYSNMKGLKRGANGNGGDSSLSVMGRASRKKKSPHPPKKNPNDLTYYGGPVISNVNIVPIIWQPGSAQVQCTDYFQAFYKSVRLFFF